MIRGVREPRFDCIYFCFALYERDQWDYHSELFLTGLNASAFDIISQKLLFFELRPTHIHAAAPRGVLL
jgi:hypothetical protein